MKKVFGQTARNLKREVNKKVLKVAGIEQKVLDATSNEPWGPHGTHLAEIAQATHNNYEYQLIMAVIWRRINDSGKNWRHVFKALIVLEYLVAHGTERVIDEIREHAYQLSTLAEFQYVDSGGRDQGINVRKKSQSLVALLNDKERIREVRQKAQVNKDRYGILLSGGSYRQSTGSYSGHPDDDTYGNMADARNGYRDDERYGSRDFDERYSRNTYQDDSYGARSNNGNQFRSRSRSVDRYPDCSFGDDDRQSSRSSSGKSDDQSQDERGSDCNLHPHNVAAPPSYEEATRSLQDIIQADRDGETVAQSSSPTPKAISPLKSSAQGAENAVAGESAASHHNTIDTFDEFDPRGSVSALPAVQPAASSQDLDIFGLSASDSTGPLALLPVNSTPSHSDTQRNSAFGSDFFSAPSSASPPSSQSDDDPFGDAPFKAIPQENIQAQPQLHQPVTSFHPSSTMGGSETLQSAPQKAETFSTFDFGDALGGLSYAQTSVNGQHASTSPSFSTTDFPVEQSSDDILDSIFPQTGSVPMSASQEVQPAARADSQTAQMNPFQSATFADLAVAQGSQATTQTDQMNPFQPSGAFDPVAIQGPFAHTRTAEMNTFQPLELPAPVASQETPTNALNHFPPSGPSNSQELTAGMQTAQMNAPQQTDVRVPAASLGSPTNMQTSQTGFLHPSGPPAPTASEPITHMQTAQINFPQPSGLSGPAASQGPQTNMQSAQTDLFQASGTPVPKASQGPQTNMQTARKNFFQPSELSTSAASQGLHPYMQTDQLNFLQPSALPVPAASEGSQTHMQTTQPNSIAPSGLPQGLQTHCQITQLDFLQPSALSTSASSQAAHSVAPPNMQLGQFGAPPNLQGGQFGAPANMQAGQFRAPANMQADQFGALPNMQAGQFGALPNMQAGQCGVPANMLAGQYGAPTNMQTGQYGTLGNIQAGQFGVPADMQGGPFRARPNMQVGQFGSLALHGLQANGQTSQPSSHQLSAQSASVSSQASPRESPSNTQAGQFGNPPNLRTTHMQLGSQSMTLDAFTSQAPIVSAGLTAKPNPSKEKFETKSTVWSDTLSRGLVNLDISGPKTNPLADVGVDFDAINRREKRLEPKGAAPPVTSTIVMGKAMGSGSGLGRSAAGSIVALPNPMMGAGMGMGMGGGGGRMGMDMGMGGYGGNMNQLPMGMNMGMNMGMGQGVYIQPPGQGMPGGGYNPMMGMGSYDSQNHQQQCGGGYR